MSRFTLRASCSTLNPNTGAEDWVNFLENLSTPQNPDRLTVFVGEMKSGSQFSALAASGGLLARQHFKWENLPTEDLDRMFILNESCSVTLDVELEPTKGGGNAYDSTFIGEIPADAMAINLSSRFGQGAADNMMEDDVWGKLVYYDTGRLGRGICFDPMMYTPPQDSKETRGIYVLGGALPDYQDSTISFAVSSSAAISTTPSINFQCGRDLSFLSQCRDEYIAGISGYWSLGYESIPPADAGNVAGKIANVDDNEVKASIRPWMHFGTPTVGYPSLLDASTNQSSSTKTTGWGAVNPIYGRPANEGTIRPGNCLPIRPSVFFTPNGYTLCSSPSSNPGGAGAQTDKIWTSYFLQAGTDKVRLTETQPFKPECPLFNTSMNIQAIPYLNQGLSLLVPITRIANGAYFYTPFSLPADGPLSSQKINPDYLGRTTDSASTPAKAYNKPCSGLCYVWFKPTKVKMTINIPVIRLDNQNEVMRYFNQLYSQNSLYANSRLWIRWYLHDDQPLSSTVTTLALNSNQLTAPCTFNVDARAILEKVSAAFSTHNISTTSGWPVSSLTIDEVMVSCSTKPDLMTAYKTLIPNNAFASTPQGNILKAGGAKVFTRNGNNLGCGAPRNVSVQFRDSNTGEMINGVKVATFENIPTAHSTIFSRANDFVTKVYTPGGSLRIPNLNDVSDMGGVLTVKFYVDQYLNYPWSGPSSTSTNQGGPNFQIKNVISTAMSSTLLAGYGKGWFNNLNPFSQDYDKGAVESTADKWPDLDSRIVNFLRRSVELWVSVRTEVPIYLSGSINDQNYGTGEKQKSASVMKMWAPLLN